MCDNAQNAQEDSLARPYVTLTYAQSLDGKLGVEGYQLLLSGSESYGMTHRLRSNHDGILVGINTVINDNPRLTARLKVCEKAHQLPSYENPQPIVLDSKLRIPLDRRLLNPEIPKYGEGIPSPKLPWLIALQGQYDMAKRQALERMGAKVIEISKGHISPTTGRPSLEHILQTLHQHNIKRLMVEGGTSVISSFLQTLEGSKQGSKRLVDECVVTISPVWVGDCGKSLHLESGQTDVIARLDNPTWAVYGKDMVVRGTFQ